MTAKPEMTKAEWDAKRLNAWRDAWRRLIDNSSADALNGMFCALNGGDLITVFVPALYGREVRGSGDTRKLWNSFSSEKKQALLDEVNEIAEGDITDTTLTEAALLAMDDAFETCMHNDETFSTDPETTEEDIDDDE